MPRSLSNVRFFPRRRLLTCPNIFGHRNLIVPYDMELTIEELRDFVRRSFWTFARTMPLIPHEYTLRSRSSDQKLFERVVFYIRRNGYREFYGAGQFTYLDLDNWKYWTMGSPPEHTTL